MSDPFTVAPPQWLVNIAKPIDGARLGEALGMGLSSLMTAFEKDPEAPEGASWMESRKGLKEGMYESRMNAQDPQWRVKGQLLANRVLSEKAQLTATAALANERQKETSAWMEDAPKLTPWITATPEQRQTMTAPEAKSKMGLGALQKQTIADQVYFTRQDQMDNRLEQERLKAQHSAGITARVQDWNDALAGSSPDTFSQIEALGPKGRLPSGLPTPQAIALVNIDRRNRGMTDFGTKSTEYLQREGSLTRQEQIRAKNLETQVNHFQKVLENPNTTEKGAAEAQSRLDAAQQQLDTLLGVKGTAKPEDNNSEDKQLRHAANVARVSGKEGDVKTATAAIQSAAKVRVLDAGGMILPKDDASRIGQIAQAKVGTMVWDPVAGKTIKLTLEMIDVAKKKAAKTYNRIEEIKKRQGNIDPATPHGMKEYDQLGDELKRLNADWSKMVAAGQ